MIYTVTLNPALDYVMDVGKITYGETNRSQKENIYFGGKGINVSYILKELGCVSTALGFVAGFTGKELEKAVQAAGINTDLISLENGNTRINVKLKSDVITEINADGPNVTEKDVAKLIKKLENVKTGDIVILSGSVPRTAPSDVYEKILASLKEKHIKAVVDTSGKRLMDCLKFNPYLIKPNKSELEELVGAELCSDTEIIEAAKKLQLMGAVNVLVSLGGDGAILVTENGRAFRQKAFSIKPENTVGAGDSMVAGYIVGLEKGEEYALKLACAAGGATAASEKLAERKEIFDLLKNKEN